MKKVFNNRAITLIALVVTIIVLLILAAITLNFLFGENSILEKTKEASFKTKFTQAEEEIKVYRLSKEVENYDKEVPLTQIQKLPVSDNLTSSNIENLKKTLKLEIQELTGIEDVTTITSLYKVDNNKVKNVQGDYIIDIYTMQLYDVNGAKYFGRWHHTLNGRGQTVEPEEEPVIIDNPIITMEGDIGWYSPNMNGFSQDYTYLIYYNENTSTTHEVTVKEYIEGGKKNKIKVNNETYYLDSYDKKMWANAKTNANSLECYWVWIPRYAYKVNSTDSQIEVVYVDLNDNPIGEISDYDRINSTTTSNFKTEYIVHPSFNVDGKKLQGIWVSKYEANITTNYEMTSDLCYGPNMDGFDKNYTYIELYDSDTNTFDSEVMYASANMSTINNNNKWYDYSKKQWANIKTTANGLECWWVWVPRYAYYVNEASKETEVIFIDTDNKPYDKNMYGNKLPQNFIVHPSFDVNGKKLQGIWISKYEANVTTDHEMTSDLCYGPNMDGFDQYQTYIELYDSDTDTFDSEIMYASANMNTINNNNKWYDYSKKQWANIKTTANGLECWWVWIPRYAYYINDAWKETEIIFIDTDNKPYDKNMYGDELPENFIVHPSFDVDGRKLQGIWVSKYEANVVNDVIGGTAPTGSTSLPQASDTAGKNHTHVANGAGTVRRRVTETSTSWCDSYDGTSPCSNYGYAIYCSLCGVRLRHYWCEVHYNPDTKVIIDDSNIT